MIDGTASGEIVGVDGKSKPTVRVDSYRAQLPSVGDGFIGTARTRSDTVETDDCPYDIYIPDGVDSYGQATGEIISVNGRIEGKIHGVTPDRIFTHSGEDDPVGSMNSQIHNTSL